MKRTVLSASFIIGALLLSGCSTAAPASTKPAASPAQATPEALGERFGDVVCFEQVTDTFGEYCHTTIASDAEVMTFDASLVKTESLTEAGFTAEDAEAALPAALRIFVEDILDSTRLDNYEQPEGDWYAQNSESTLPAELESYLPYIKNGGDDELWTYGQVVSGVLPQPTVRDGGPRATGGTYIGLDEVRGQTLDGGDKVLVFALSSTSVYDVTDEQAIETFRLADESVTEASLTASNPELFDGTNDSQLTVTTSGLLAFGTDSLEQMHSRSFNMKLTLGAAQVIRTN